MPENSNSGIIRKIVLSAALGSIVVILILSGFGFVPWLAGASLTILHIPVILAAVLQGYTSALIVGAVFGISSLIMAAIRPAPGSFDFLFVNPLISILPRLVFAFLAALIYKAMSKINDKFSVPFTAFVSSLIHTVLVLGILYIILFFAPMPENVEIAGEIQGTGESFLGRIHSLYISTLVNSGGTAALPLTVIGLSILSNGIPEAVLAAIIVSLVTFAYRGIEGKTRKSLLAEIEEKKEN